MSCPICSQPDYIQCGCDQEAYCEPCSSDNKCITKIDAECVIYHRDDNKPTKLTCMGLPNGSTSEEIFEKFDTYICNTNNANTPIVVYDSPSIDLTAWGTINHTLQADVNISEANGNTLIILEDGLFASSGITSIPTDFTNLTVDNGLTKTGNNIQLGGGLTQNTSITDAAYYLYIEGDTSIGTLPPSTTSRGKLTVAKGTNPNTNAASMAIKSNLIFSDNAAANNNTLYGGVVGSFDYVSIADRVLLPATHYAGLVGVSTVYTDFAITNGMLSGVTSLAILYSQSVGNYTTHGKLAKYSGFRARAPLQNAINSTQEHGGIEDVYGLYIEVQKAGDLAARIDRSWGIYQEDSEDNNFFASTIKTGGTETIDPSAQLEITSTTKGLLLPRMTKAQRNLISSPVAGLAIYQTDNTPGLRVYNGVNWMKFTESTD